MNVPEWFAERYRTLPFSSTVSGGAATTRKARALMVEDWPATHHEHLRRAGGIASALLPLEVQGKLSGLVVLCRNREERYEDEDLSTAELLADQVAVQVERARLVLALRQSYDELALAQKELVKRERLAALGELSAVIAHEVRNPLGVLFNSLASLRHMPLTNDARELLAIVSEESERLDRLVSDLLDFARPNEPRLAPESAALLVMSAVETARRGTALQSVTVRVDVPPGLPPVQIDMQLCRQALLNLLLNAAQATGRGGEVVVRARLETAALPPMVRLDVCDSGSGIAPEVADRIFQPFFTTRASGTQVWGSRWSNASPESHRAEGRLRVEQRQGLHDLLASAAGVSGLFGLRVGALQPVGASSRTVTTHSTAMTLTALRSAAAETYPMPPGCLRMKAITAASLSTSAGGVSRPAKMSCCQ